VQRQIAVVLGKRLLHTQQAMTDNTDDIDWSLTKFEGNRLRQHREFLALSFREKMQWIEDPAKTAAHLRQLPRDPRSADTKSTADER
jgi:hypothetical protein